MALVACPNCGEEISDVAIKCPHCGFEVADYWKREKEQESVAGTKSESATGEESQPSSEVDNTVVNEDSENDQTENPESYTSHETQTTNINNTTSSYKKEYIKPLKTGLIIVAVVFVIVAAVFFYRGYDVKNNYYHNDSYSILDQNAYVGGDAYNIIINGTYFVGYVVAGTGCMLCAVICGLGVIMVGIKERDQELMEQLNNINKQE